MDKGGGGGGGGAGERVVRITKIPLYDDNCVWFLLSAGRDSTASSISYNSFFIFLFFHKVMCLFALLSPSSGCSHCEQL